MFFGIAVWAALIGIGLMRSIMSAVPGNEVAIMGVQEGACRTILYPAGLRGAIIGWSDGVFGGSFKNAYFGPAGG